MFFIILALCLLASAMIIGDADNPVPSWDGRRWLAFGLVAIVLWSFWWGLYSVVVKFL